MRQKKRRISRVRSTHKSGKNQVKSSQQSEIAESKAIAPWGRLWGAHRREISGERDAAQMDWLESLGRAVLTKLKTIFCAKPTDATKLISKDLLDTRLPTYLIPLFP